MFSGIVIEKGKILAINKRSGSSQLVIGCKKILEGLKVGDSVSVSGVCLTATAVISEHFSADVVAETLSKTAIGKLHEGSYVNLEPSLKLSDVLGGHLVTGHVDCTALIERIEKVKDSKVLYIKPPDEFLDEIVPRGSVSLDGISLTVASVEGKTFKVALIPHTLEVTTLGERKAGDYLNLETDIIAKYVKRMLIAAKGNVTEDMLKKTGFIL